MKTIRLFIFSILLFVFGCKEDTSVNELEIKKAAQEKELVFSNLKKTWNFSERALTPESKTITTSWNEWRLFSNELYQKPTATISAFKLKTKNLVQKAEVLPNTLPEKLNKPQVKIRLAALITKLNALNMFLNIDKIPQERVIQMITDLQLEVNAFNDQIEEIVRRSQIQLEEGEEIMLQQIGGKIQAVDTISKNKKQEQVVPSFEVIK
jgi:hypothetical protein